MNPPSAAVIGADLSGIACAQRLSAAGWQLRVFESQRAPGGRIATRRFEAASFDHGAQYFSVREPSFHVAIERARLAGMVERWRPCWPRGDQERGELWVGSPGMNALPRFLSKGLDIEYVARITRLERTRKGWMLIDDRGAGQLGRKLPEIMLSDTHLWRHARVETALGEPFLLDQSGDLGFCGDWCLDARVEAAFLSGDAIGKALSETRYTDSSGKMRDSR